MGFQLLSMLDEGNKTDLEISQIQNAIEEGQIVQFLEKELGDELNLSIYDETTKAQINSKFQEMDVTRLKPYGVENNGIYLVLALILELIQHAENYGLEFKTRR